MEKYLPFGTFMGGRIQGGEENLDYTRTLPAGTFC